MKSDITTVIKELILKSYPDLENRFHYQEEALRETKCTTPVLGRWIDQNDVKYLLASLALDDADFAGRFPRMAQVGAADRRRLIETFNEHFEHCQHCSLKRGYDWELDGRIKQVCKDNRETLLQMLSESEEESTDGEPPTGAFEASWRCRLNRSVAKQLCEESGRMI
jgi:hypothetical protein